MKVIAHRGASGDFPENTLEAFEQAIVQGADGIELDVQYHPCGALLLLHDRFLEKTTNGKGYFDHTDIAELAQLTTANGEKIPHLSQALALIAGRCLLNIELKLASSNKDEMAKLIVLLQRDIENAITIHNFQWSQLIISSFNHHLLLAIKDAFPLLKTAALIASNPIGLSDFAKTLQVSSVNPAIDCLDDTFVKHAHNAGYEVWVYTVDKIEDITVCLALGIDAIFTNYPSKTRNIINNINNGLAE